MSKNNRRGNPNFIKKLPPVQPNKELDKQSNQSDGSIDAATQAKLDEINELTKDVKSQGPLLTGAVQEYLAKYTKDGDCDYYSAFADYLGIDRDIIKKLVVGLYNRMHPAKLLASLMEKE